jgi:hypothetical protein
VPSSTRPLLVLLLSHVLRFVGDKFDLGSCSWDSEEDCIKNMDKAFLVAEKDLGVTVLLDGEGLYQR